MEQMQDYHIILEQLTVPAFWVQNGIITAVNRRAAQYMAEPETPVASILASGQEEYSRLQTGSIYLNISLCGVTHRCSVTHWESGQLFTIEESTSNAELQVLALAAQQLCIPMSELSLLLEQNSDMTHGQKAKICHSLNKLQRIIGNMSDTALLTEQKPNMVTHELCAVFAETLEKAKELLSHSSLNLEYSVPNQPVYTLAEPEMLKRAIYNLISNAAKFTPYGGTIRAVLQKIGNRLYFSVTDGSKNTKASSSNIFHRYSRQPGLEDPRFGLGLGITLIHAAAAAHGGTVLAEQTEDHCLKITMTVAIQKSKSNDVRSPVLIPDLYGGRDQALIELADVLPYHLYQD